MRTCERTDSGRGSISLWEHCSLPILIDVVNCSLSDSGDGGREGEPDDADEDACGKDCGPEGSEGTGGHRSLDTAKTA